MSHKEHGIPEDAFKFNQAGICEFIGGDGDDKNNIRLTLYDGSIVKHWYWGNLAFDLGTIKPSKLPMPILVDHDTAQRVGVSTGMDTEGKFILEGKFLSSDLAQSIKADAAEGFPFEASLRFDPDKSKIEHIKEGESVKVNGKKLKGPGALISNTHIMEGSICTFGALNKCKTEVFERNPIMSESETKIEMTVSRFESEYPDIFKNVSDAAKEEGRKEERELFGKFVERFGKDPAFVIEHYSNGLTLTEAISERNTKLEKKVEEYEKKATKETTSTDNVDPAIVEFSDNKDDSANSKNLEGEELYKHEFATDQGVRDEFGHDGLDVYMSYRKAKDANLVKIK